MLNTDKLPLIGAIEQIIKKIDEELKRRESLNLEKEENKEELSSFNQDNLNIDNFEECLTKHGGQFHYTSFLINDKVFNVKFWTNDKTDFLVIGMEEPVKQEQDAEEPVKEEHENFKEATRKIIALAKERLETAENLIKAIAKSQYDKVTDLIEDLKDIDKEKDEILENFKK